jgi:hypothetical protein
MNALRKDLHKWEVFGVELVISTQKSKRPLLPTEETKCVRMEKQ